MASISPSLGTRPSEAPAEARVEFLDAALPEDRKRWLDHWSAWLGGTTFPWAYTDQAVERAAAHRLTLTP